MIAYKFLCAGAVGPFSGLAWPAPGEWIEAGGELDPCRRGIHACRAQHLPRWIDEELWRIELAGEIREEATVLVASAGRLVERLESWSGELRQAFARACAARLGGLTGRTTDPVLAQYAADVAAAAQGAADPKTCAFTAYAAAHAAEHAAADGYWRERELQARWLAERLGL